MLRTLTAAAFVALVATLPARQETAAHALLDPIDLTLPDATRAKPMKVRVHAPASGGPYPVIVFSHGFGGSREVGEDLMRHWAAAGFVVVATEHLDRGKLREAIRPGGRQAMGLYLADPDNWRRRVADVVLVLDALPGLGERDPRLAGRIDATRTGVGGHSFGAYTTMLVAGAKVDISTDEQDVTMGDPRPRAFCVLSGQGTGHSTFRGFDEGSWQPIAEPMFVATGSRDEGLGQTPEMRTEPYQFATAGDKYLLFLEDAAHMTFTGRGTRVAAREPLIPRRGTGLLAPPAANEKELFESVKSTTLAFWKAHLADDAEAAAFLKSDAPATAVPGATARWEWK